MSKRNISITSVVVLAAALSSCGEGSASTDGVNIAASDNVCVMVGNSGNCTSTTRATGAGGGQQDGGEEDGEPLAEVADIEPANSIDTQSDAQSDFERDFYDPGQIANGIIAKNNTDEEYAGTLTSFGGCECSNQ